ncbi:glycosyl hydrolase family 17 protein [Alteromonas facilis]|uniref:glycosyl hydrolase family 17 protein n=1 Tax=Alteromonas facilis TaxID=2048004 RepID=UPI000C28D487|nr:glycosyl hydrolase family 17 protein [Alteromonas facilis]
MVRTTALIKTIRLFGFILLTLAGVQTAIANVIPQDASALLAGESFGLAYSGFREGQHPDRGQGANNPSAEEILEDLKIMQAHGITLIRLYDAGENSRMTLALIKQHQLPFKVVQGIWLDAEISNHEGCPWLDEPIPAEKLSLNKTKNQVEIERGIALANQYSDIILAVNVGNEALVEWNDHMVPLQSVIEYVKHVKGQIVQPVTVADNYEWWIKDGAPLVEHVDFLGVHTYPIWENKPLKEAMQYSIENIKGVQHAHPNKPIAILEAGWATTASEFPQQATSENQAKHLEELHHWSRENNITVLFFEAFDEPWKGNPDNTSGAEKHWGVFFVDRQAKPAAKIMQKLQLSAH